MGVIRLNYQQIDEIRKNKPLGIGKEGSCYLYKNNEVIKLYHSFFRTNKLYFADLKDKNIAFPKDIILYENTDLILGYTMPYFKGVNIVNGFSKDLDLETLKYSFIILKDLIKKYKDIYMDDMCLDNIFYNDNNSSFSLIDTSRWYPKADGYKDSINDINWIFVAGLLINIKGIKKNIYEDNIFRDLYAIYYKYELEANKRISGMSYDKINIDGLFKDFLINTEKKVSEVKGYKVKKISDLKI